MTKIIALFSFMFFVLISLGFTQELGQIDFPTSGVPEAQQRFLRGMLYLHSFEYSDARTEFEAAEFLQPSFAMAYWGDAMSYNHPIWQEEDWKMGREALNRLAPTPEKRLEKAGTEREKDYLAAVEILYRDGDKKSRDVAYSDAMRHIYEKYPDDLEAATLYALSLLGTCHEGRDFAVYMKAAAILEEVFARNPKHPGAIHYLIHSYDDPIHAPLGLRAARVYAKTAPAASHAQHMPSHIFLALGMWDDVVSSNEVSFQVADERVKRKKLSSEARNYHALHWLEYGYLQQGRIDDAKKMLDIMSQDALNSKSIRARVHLAVMRATYLIETEDCGSETASQALDLADTSLSARSSNYFATGFCQIKTGKLDDADKTLSALKDSRTSSRVTKAEGHHSANIYSQVWDSDVQSAMVMEKELEAMLLFARDKKDAAIELLQTAVKEEEGMNFEFGPPSIVKPSAELLGEMLLLADQVSEAKNAFERSLARAPRRVHSLRGLADSSEKSGNSLLARQTRLELESIQRSKNNKDVKQ